MIVFGGSPVGSTSVFADFLVALISLRTLRLSAPIPICRYLSVEIIAGELPHNMTISAWGVKYEYEQTDSTFISSNATLNGVHELARWTLDGEIICLSNLTRLTVVLLQCSFLCHFQEHSRLHFLLMFSCILFHRAISGGFG